MFYLNMANRVHEDARPRPTVASGGSCLLAARVPPSGLDLSGEPIIIRTLRQTRVKEKDRQHVQKQG